MRRSYDTVLCITVLDCGARAAIFMRENLIPLPLSSCMDAREQP